MSGKFAVGQRVRIIGVDEIPYGMKYSYLESTIDKTGVVQDDTTLAPRLIIRLDDDGTLINLSEGCLQKVE
jgi:hypothetical protein